MFTFFLETTAVINLFFKNKERSQKVKDTVTDVSFCMTSQYVVYEISKGFLRNLILLHNRAQSVKKFSDLLFYIHSLAQSPHRHGTMFEQIAFFFENLKITGKEQGDIGDSDEINIRLIRAHLQNCIRRGWNKVGKISRVVNEMECNPNLESPYFKEGLLDQDINTAHCGKKSNCKLQEYIIKNKDNFNAIRNKLIELPQKDYETEKRIKSLKELSRNSNKDFNRNDCYNSGDAIIANQTPVEMSLVTSNMKHLKPICEAIDKALKNCDE
jgi:hypothetical protein